MLVISAIAIPVGVLSALIAIALIDLIGFITNGAYYHRLSFSLVSPTSNSLGWWGVMVPVVGGLVIGIMARYGSERIRGHGIPEAIETILVGGSKIEPRVAVLKPISSAISIGTGGPFGAEGPIILTGGAFGSLVGQLFSLSAVERKTLLVAGASAGMAAIFNTPVAAVLIAIELLVFELKPRSAVPVAIATVVSTAVRWRLIGSGPMFPTPNMPAVDEWTLAGTVVIGVLAGILSWLLTIGVYGAEDAFRKLPIHWMWWPAIGGVFVGVGGAFFPRALGVGYDTIGDMLNGQLTFKVLLGVLFVKAIIWCLALGSGTSGGILAPLLIMGGALGALESSFLPGHFAPEWALIGMASALGGVMRSPLTATIFALELTHDLNLILALLLACYIAHTMTVLILKRSILTEKVARRGFHVMREYSVDPLEAIFVREVMRTNIVTLSADTAVGNLPPVLRSGDDHHRQRLYGVLDGRQNLVGVVTRSELERIHQQPSTNGTRVYDAINHNPVVAYADDTLRAAAERMAEARVGEMPVVDRRAPQRLVGMLSLRDVVLRGRSRVLEEERTRERVLRMRVLPARRPPVVKPIGTEASDTPA
jgi:CIC family chloride channel protein